MKMALDKMDDETFMQYVRSHSRAERHAFHRNDVNRMGELAGVDTVVASNCELSGFYGVDQYEADRLIGLWEVRKNTDST
jgi:hypothetical protein